MPLFLFFNIQILGNSENINLLPTHIKCYSIRFLTISFLLITIIILSHSLIVLRMLANPGHVLPPLSPHSNVLRSCHCSYVSRKDWSCGVPLGAALGWRKICTGSSEVGPGVAPGLLGWILDEGQEQLRTPAFFLSVGIKRFAREARQQ